ncbi:MAG: glycosyltransferase family 2 protein [Lentisphaeria bacterium]|nr:glycosyltransferase family 2 protein [Lentisphaeria bacterium]
MPEKKHKLSVIIPVYNEETTVGSLLEKVVSSSPGIPMELVIVNDGSTDRSAEKIRCFLEKHAACDPSISFQYLEKTNGGKGSALKKGIAASSGSIVIIQDADLEYDPADYVKCIRPIMEGRTKVVYGSREAENRNRFYSAPSFYLGGLVLSFWMDLLYNATLTDEPTCYKTFDGDLIRSLKVEGNKFDWEVEVTSKLLRLGFSIMEVPVSYYPRKLDSGKKIRAKDGFQGLWTALKWRFKSIADQKKALAESRQGACFTRFSTTRTKTVWALWGLLFLALLLRLAYALPHMETAMRTPGLEDRFYIETTAAVRKHFCNYSPEKKTVDFVEIRKAPLYGTFLSLFKNAGGNRMLMAELAGLFLTVLALYAVYAGASALGGWKAGLWASGLYTLSPLLIAAAFPGAPYWGITLFLFLLSLQFCFVLRFLKTGLQPDLFCAAVAGALAALTDSRNLFWSVPVILLILLYKNFSLRRKAEYIFLLLLVNLVILFPAFALNRNFCGAWRIDGEYSDRLFLSAMLLSLKTDRANFDTNFRKNIRETWEKSKKDSSSGKVDAGTYFARRDKEMFRIIFAQPAEYGKLLFNKNVLVPFRQDLYQKQEQYAAEKFKASGRGPVKGFMPFVTVLSYVVWLLTILGISWFVLLDPFRNKGFALLLLLLTGAFYLLEPVSSSSIRNQIFLLPFLLMVAGGGLSFFFECVKNNRKEKPENKI